ncbi:hypothetical protein BT69DRAFT_1278106 [Atractiella rhizophila]|nr:hypothetical protein BT69DRAFT_1278106 [Atractiella rhizophila]
MPVGTQVSLGRLLLSFRVCHFVRIAISSTRSSNCSTKGCQSHSHKAHISPRKRRPSVASTSKKSKALDSASHQAQDPMLEIPYTPVFAAAEEAEKRK